MKLTWFLKPNTVLHGGGLHQRNSLTSFTSFSGVITSREWCFRVSLLSPHRHFVSKKTNGKWCIVHAYNKLNATTIPALTPFPTKDALQNNMAGSTMYSALDLVDGYYQLLMRTSDIPLTAVSTPSGML